VVLEYATESIVLQPFHDKLFQVISRTHQSEGQEIRKNCDLMNSLKLDMSSLGTEVDLDPFRPRDQVKQMIETLCTKKTPMEKMVTFKDILNMIREDLMQCIRDAHSPFDPSPLKTLVPDDLVAATIFTLTQNQADQVYYHLNFVQTFGTRLPAMNELAYSLVTFEVALAYIRNYRDEMKQEKQDPNTPSKSLSQSESPSKRHEEAFPWQSSLSPIADQADSGKRRSSSFMSFRTRDHRFDTHLKELNRLVNDISFSGSETLTSEPDSSPVAESDEDLGSVCLPISLFCYSDPHILLSMHQCLS
jgi:hypothetical protein